MELRRPMARRAAVAGLSLLLLFGTVACAGSGPVGARPVATVGGHDITLDELRERMDTDKDIALAIAKVPNAGITAQDVLAQFKGSGTKTLPMEASATALTKLIQSHVLRSVLKERGGSVTADDRAQAKQQVAASLQQQGVSIDDVPAVYVDDQVEQFAVGVALTRTVKPSAAALQAEYEKMVGSYTQVCASALVTKDEAAAKAVQTRLTGGEEFATVFAEANTDEQLAQAKGDIGCGAVADVQQSLGPEVVPAQPGTVFAPKQFADGWVTFVITERKVPALQDIAPDLTAELAKGEVQKILQAGLKDTKVSVNPRYGRWDRDQVAVVAPKDPLATTTTAVPTVPGS